MKREDRAQLGGLGTNNNWKSVCYGKLTGRTIPKILSVSPLTTKNILHGSVFIINEKVKNRPRRLTTCICKCHCKEIGHCLFSTQLFSLL